MADNQLQSRDKLEILGKFHDLQYTAVCITLYYMIFKPFNVDAAYRVELILSYDSGHSHVAEK